MGTELSIVIPCYNSERDIPAVVEQTVTELDRLGVDSYEFILINDDSRDGTYKAIKALAEKYPFVTGVDLARNSGQHNAILAGFHYASGDLILGMDDDFQTHPSQIGRLLDKIREGYDIVYGKFIRRHHNYFRNLGSLINEYSMRVLVGKPKNITACPMYVIRRFVRDEVIRSGSRYTNLQGLFLRTSSKIANVEIEHFDRVSGVSGYTLRKLIRLWSSVMNYTEKPVLWIAALGAFEIAGSALAFPCGAFISFILLLSGLTTLSIALMGLYTVRMFMIISHDPQFVIREDTVHSREELLHHEENSHTGRG